MLLKQYHAIADERGCCLRDMDFLVKKFQLLVPKNHIIALSSSAVIFLRTAAKELSFLGYAFSLEFEKNFWKKGTESHTPLCQTIFSGNTGHMMLPRSTILRVISTNECKAEIFFCFGLSTSHFMALGICIDFSFNSGEYSIALKLKVLVFKHATSTNNHTNFLWKIRVK